jgi:hypothetical protein
MASQFDALSKKYMDRMKFVAKTSSIQLGNEIVSLTPVDSGIARASWSGAIGAPLSISSPSTSRNPSIEFEISLKQLGIGDVVYFTNPQPYIVRLEYGWSAKAPRGMVRRSVARWEQIVDQKTRDSFRVIK